MSWSKKQGVQYRVTITIATCYSSRLFNRVTCVLVILKLFSSQHKPHSSERLNRQWGEFVDAVKLFRRSSISWSLKKQQCVCSASLLKFKLSAMFPEGHVPPLICLKMPIWLQSKLTDILITFKCIMWTHSLTQILVVKVFSHTHTPWGLHSYYSSLQQIIKRTLIHLVPPDGAFVRTRRCAGWADFHTELTAQKDH